MGAFFMPFGFVPFASSLLAGGCGACSSRTMSFPALAAATDGSAKRRRAVSQTEGRDWWPPCFTVRYGDRFGTFAFVGVVSCRLGEIRHLGVPAGQGNRKSKRGGPWQALPLFLVYGRALTGPERLPAGWARRVRGPRAGSARRAPPARVRQAARFPQARACLPREQGPQPPRPG